MMNMMMMTMFMIMMMILLVTMMIIMVTFTRYREAFNDFDFNEDGHISTKVRLQFE